jgi:hypothetical protein
VSIHRITISWPSPDASIFAMMGDRDGSHSQWRDEIVGAAMATWQDPENTENPAIIADRERLQADGLWSAFLSARERHPRFTRPLI